MKLDLPRSLAVVAALLAVAVLAVLSHLVRRYEPGRPIGQDLTEDAVLSASNAVMLARDRGQTLWRLRVARIALRRSPDADLVEFHTAVFENVHEGRLYRGGRPDASFSARMATYERLPRLLQVEGHLRLEARGGEVFSAPRCVWSERESVARFPQGGHAVIRGDELQAPVMLYEPGNKIVRCPQGASARVRGQEVAAASLEWDLERRQIRCDGPITGTHGRMRFTAQHAELDLEARLLRVNKGSLDLRMDME